MSTSIHVSDIEKDAFSTTGGATCKVMSLLAS